MPAIEEITEFQLKVARRWIDEGRSVQQAHFKFVAYFGAVNALYWLWGMADMQVAFTDDEREQAKAALEQAPEPLRSKVRDRLRGLRNEAQLINHLIDRIVEHLGEDAANRIVTGHQDYVLFMQDRGFLFRMDTRDRENSVGDRKQADRYIRDLGRAGSNVVKLKALGGLLYIIRCNLVHGSKATEFDEDLITRGVPPLKSLAEAALEATSRCRPA